MSITSELIDKCRRNKTSAQIQLFELCYGRLMPVCTRYVDVAEAPGMLNLGFYKVLKGLKEYDFRDETLFMHWARRVLINAIIDELRSQKRYKAQHTSVDHTEMNGVASLASFNMAELALDAEHIYAMIDQLPDMQKQVFNMYVIDSYAHKEIGEMLEMSENTSRWYLAQARKGLQAMLAVHANHQTKIKA